ncbi:ISKra4 family transposase [Thermodesulfobacteriota bacterium]
MEDKILQAREEFNSILEFVTKKSGDLEIHQVEEGIFRYLLGLGRILLEVFIGSVGTGKQGERVVSEEGEEFRYLRDVPRQYLSIFGKVLILRAYYFKKGRGGTYPLDAKLNLPEQCYSYLLQKWMAGTGVRQTYQSAVQWVEEFLGLDIPHRGLERVIENLRGMVNQFNETLETPPPEEEGTILVQAVDGKGIPMCVKDRNPDAVKTPERPGKKKMACVAATYSLLPFYREAEHIVASLFRKDKAGSGKKRPSRCKPLHKRIVASLQEGKASVFRQSESLAKARITENIQEKVILIDGEIALWKLAGKHFDGWTQIIDLIHVMEKLWIAAHQYHKKNSPEAEEYVKERVRLLLQGRLDWVLEDLEVSTKDGTLSRKRAAIVKSKVVGYFRRNAHRMRYDEYLKLGLPITTAIIESGCKNLINDRMERSGMIWSSDGAEAMLKVRSMLLQGTWNEFWEHRIQTERERRYQDSAYLSENHASQPNLARAA